PRRPPPSPPSATRPCAAYPSARSPGACSPPPCRPVTNRSCCVTRAVSSTWPTSPTRRPPHTTTTAPCGCPSTPDRPEPSWPTPYVCADRPEPRSEEHTSELQSRFDLVCRL